MGQATNLLNDFSSRSLLSFFLSSFLPCFGFVTGLILQHRLAKSSPWSLGLSQTQYNPPVSSSQVLRITGRSQTFPVLFLFLRSGELCYLTHIRATEQRVFTMLLTGIKP